MHDISTCETGIGDYSLYLVIPRDFNLIASSNKVCCILVLNTLILKDYA